jgi:transposase-like protein
VTSIVHPAGPIGLVERSADTGVAQGCPDEGRSLDSTTKERALELVGAHARVHGSLSRACTAVGQALGIPRTTVRGWAREAYAGIHADGGPRGVGHGGPAEVEALRDEVRRLQEENVALRAFTTFLADRRTARSA